MLNTNNTHFGDNIKLLRKRKKYTQEDVARAINMKRSTLSGYENYIAQPNMHSLITLSEYYNVSIDTLLKINFNLLSESQLLELEKGFDVFVRGSKLRVLTTTVNNDNEENIELVNEKAKAGYTNGFADPEYIKELPVFNLPFLSKQKKYRTFQINGDSMLPIPDGSWITGEFIQDWNHLKDNTACIVLTLDEGIVFKIAENKLKTSQDLRLHSLNPLYEPYNLKAGEIKEIWKFINYISSEIPAPQLPNDNLISQIENLAKDMKKVKNKLKL